jgi:hypothetical protein
MTALTPSDPPPLTVHPSTVMEVDRIARWDICLRLRELSIPCQCQCGEPLRVQIDNAIAAIQIWCVVQACTASQRSHVEHLEKCWGLSH